MLADRFETELDLYHKELAKFLKDPITSWQRGTRRTSRSFSTDLRNRKYPTIRRDCGKRLWRFYSEYLKATPDIPMEAEAVLKHMVETLVGQRLRGAAADPRRGIAVHEEPDRRPAD